MSRRTPFVAGLLALPLLLGGCGLGETVAGIHDAPAESSDGASMTEQTAGEVADRVLDLAADHRSSGGSSGAEERERIFSGPALREAKASSSSKERPDHPSEEAEDRTVLGISRGHDWPRAILATSQEEGTQYLHVLVAEAPDQSFTLFAEVRMAAGASVPALAPVAEGVPVSVADDPGEEASSAASAWAKGMAHPRRGAAPQDVDLDDTFSTALRKNAKKQDEDLDDLATYRQRQSTADAGTVSFDLAEGGQLSFVPMTRTDTFTVGRKAKELTLGDRGVRRVLDTSKVKRSLTITHAETIALVTPESGSASLVGANEVLRSAEGR